MLGVIFGRFIWIDWLWVFWVGRVRCSYGFIGCFGGFEVSIVYSVGVRKGIVVIGYYLGGCRGFFRVRFLKLV